MKNSKILIFFFILISANYSLAQELTKKENVFAYLLTSDNFYDVKLGAKFIYYDGNANVMLTDFVAEIFLAGCKNRQFDSDTRSWLAKALSSTSNSRYVKVLEKCMEEIKNNNHIKNALLSLSKSPTIKDTPYIAGEIDLASRKAHYQNIIKSNPSLSEKDKFNQIRIGDKLDHVLGLLSHPDQINSSLELTSNHAPWPARRTVSQQHLQLHYSKMGIIRIDDGDKGGVVTRIIDASVNSTGGENIYHQQLMSPDVVTFTTATRILYNNQIQDETTLDIAMSRLWQDKYSQDTRLIDNLAWIIKSIGQSKNARYRDALSRISQLKIHRKLKRYSSAALSTLPNTNVPQFDVGN